MLRLINLEEIQNELLAGPELVNLAQNKDSTFIVQTKNWLVKMESILKNNKIPEASRISAMRGTIIAAELGNMPVEIINQKNASRSKVKQIAALHILKQATDTVFSLIQKDADRVTESEKIMNQILSVAKAKGLIKDIPDDRPTEILKAWWTQLSNDHDVAPGVISIEGLVGPHDSWILFDRALTRFLEN